MGIGNRLIASAAFATALVAGTALASNSSRAATVLYDNLSALTHKSDPASNVSGPLYDSFLTGNSAIVFSSLQLLLSATTDDSGTFTIYLLSDPNNPSSVIGSSDPRNVGLLSPTPSVVSFTPSIPLAANTRYWIELSSTGSVHWAWTDVISGVGIVGVANEFFANSFGGANSDQFAVHPNSDGGPYQMEVIGTPLPASWIMMLTGLAGFGFLAAYRRRKNGSVALAAA